MDEDSLALALGQARKSLDDCRADRVTGRSRHGIKDSIFGDILQQIRRAYERAELHSKGIAAEDGAANRKVKWTGEVQLRSLEHEGDIVGRTRKAVKRFGSIDPVKLGA